MITWRDDGMNAKWRLMTSRGRALSSTWCLDGRKECIVESGVVSQDSCIHSVEIAWRKLRGDGKRIRERDREREKEKREER